MNIGKIKDMTLEYKGKNYKINMEDGSLKFYELLENGELKEDDGIKNELTGISFKEKILNKIDNILRKAIFKHSHIPDPDVHKMGKCVFIDTSSHQERKNGIKRYEFSHFEK